MCIRDSLWKGRGRRGGNRGHWESAAGGPREGPGERRGESEGRQAPPAPPAASRGSVFIGAGRGGRSSPWL
eukprot:7400097-Alexandrium_andersonii.AAC.1